MPRGGPRVGSGRPKGATNRPKAAPIDIQDAATMAGVGPLDYMLSVMRDPTADAARRDRMAVAAAPYLHLKPAEAGKK